MFLGAEFGHNMYLVLLNIDQFLKFPALDSPSHLYFWNS